MQTQRVEIAEDREIGEHRTACVARFTFLEQRVTKTHKCRHHFRLEISLCAKLLYQELTRLVLGLGLLANVLPVLLGADPPPPLDSAKHGACLILQTCILGVEFTLHLNFVLLPAI